MIAGGDFNQVFPGSLERYPNDTQYYVIDGFIISPNVQLELVETLNLDFENSDHNPVHLTVKPK